ncbi:MAG: hypothetical protein HY694_01085 [Deltaproteobacteria bacterium]|nr:hypothetical protein [Deltaproteobacteria bacterium]
MAVGVVLVHGIGEQRPGDFLKDFINSLVHFLQNTYRVKFSTPPGLLMPTFPAPQTALEVRNNQGRLIETLNLYEVYWGDLGEPGSESVLKTLGQAFWSIQTSLRPLARAINLPGGAGAKPTDCIFVGILGLGVWLLGIVLHLLDFLTLIGTLFFRRWAGAARGIRRTLLGYIGDIKVYTGEKEWVNRGWIIWRFRQMLSHANAENQRVIVVGHSLGSVIAYNGLTQGALCDSPVIDNVSALFTLGSPLAKIAYVWPELISLRPDPLPNAPFPVPRIQWYNFHDFMDPIGANLSYYQRGEETWRWPRHNTEIVSLHNRFVSPGQLDQPLRNFPIVRGWSPVSAHTGYWREERVIGHILREAGVNIDPPAMSHRRIFTALFLRVALIPTVVFLLLSALQWQSPHVGWEHVRDSLASWVSKYTSIWVQELLIQVAEHLRPVADFFVREPIEAILFSLILWLIGWLVVIWLLNTPNLKKEICWNLKGIVVLVFFILALFGLFPLAEFIYCGWANLDQFFQIWPMIATGALLYVVIAIGPLLYAIIWAGGRFLAKPEHWFALRVQLPILFLVFLCLLPALYLARPDPLLFLALGIFIVVVSAIFVVTDAGKDSWWISVFLVTELVLGLYFALSNGQAIPLYVAAIHLVMTLAPLDLRKPSFSLLIIGVLSTSGFIFLYLVSFERTFPLSLAAVLLAVSFPSFALAIRRVREE